MSNPNYPEGAEHDPRAPYNQTNPDVCPKCSGDGMVGCPDCRSACCAECDDTGKIVCPECDGTGELYRPSREEIAIEKADAAMDKEKDEEP